MESAMEIDSPKKASTDVDLPTEKKTEAQPSSRTETEAAEVDSSKNGPTSDTNIDSKAQPAVAAPPSDKTTVSEASSASEPSVENTSTNDVTNGPLPKKQCVDHSSMSTGVYLDSTVVPILHGALVTLDRLRPADPVQFVIDFLLRNKAQYSKSKEQPVSSTPANQA